MYYEYAEDFGASNGAIYNPEVRLEYSVGTTITVQKLFFNTPVRYKFLKKDFTESGYIEDAITRIALANPDIGIKAPA